MSETIVWSADTGRYVELDSTSSRATAVAEIRKQLREDSSSEKVREERSQSRLRWSEAS